MDESQSVQSEGMTEAVNASAGQCLGFVSLGWLSTGMEMDSGGTLEDKLKVALQPVDAW